MRADVRGFSHVDAIAMFSEPLSGIVRTYKYEAAAAGWATIFGRLIVGWLERNRPPVDLILGNPTAEGRQPHQHVELMLAAAEIEDPGHRWPIVPRQDPVLVKVEPTERSAGSRWPEKWVAAVTHAEAIEVVRPRSLRGARVLLVDDVFTTGAQFVTVSRLLRKAGAVEVQGLVLARTPWG